MPSTAIKLLIVDDEPATRSLLSQIFQQMGHEVRCAEDGFSALERIRETVPDVLLSDLNMPGMSGFELLSVVRRKRPQIYVIATSGAYSGEAVPRGIAADAFYEKAGNLRYLMGLIAALPQQTHASNPPTGNRSADAATPIWIQIPPPREAREETAPDSGAAHSQSLPVQERMALRQEEKAFVMLGCPECLRTFPEDVRDNRRIIHTTACLHCHSPIHYAIVQTAQPAAAQAFLSA
jgi:CheY-like chemotaxis protein